MEQPAAQQAWTHELPMAILCKIMGHCGSRAIASMSCTCKALHAHRAHLSEVQVFASAGARDKNPAQAIASAASRALEGMLGAVDFAVLFTYGYPLQPRAPRQSSDRPAFLSEAAVASLQACLPSGVAIVGCVTAGLAGTQEAPDGASKPENPGEQGWAERAAAAAATGGHLRVVTRRDSGVVLLLGRMPRHTRRVVTDGVRTVARQATRAKPGHAMSRWLAPQNLSGSATAVYPPKASARAADPGGTSFEPPLEPAAMWIFCAPDFFEALALGEDLPGDIIKPGPGQGPRVVVGGMCDAADGRGLFFAPGRLGPQPHPEWSARAASFVALAVCQAAPPGTPAAATSAANGGRMGEAAPRAAAATLRSLTPLAPQIQARSERVEYATARGFPRSVIAMLHAEAVAGIRTEPRTEPGFISLSGGEGWMRDGQPCFVREGGDDTGFPGDGADVTGFVLANAETASRGARLRTPHVAVWRQGCCSPALAPAPHPRLAADVPGYGCVCCPYGCPALLELGDLRDHLWVHVMVHCNMDNADAGLAEHLCMGEGDLCAQLVDTHFLGSAVEVPALAQALHGACASGAVLPAQHEELLAHACWRAKACGARSGRVALGAFACSARADLVGEPAPGAPPGTDYVPSEACLIDEAMGQEVPFIYGLMQGEIGPSHCAAWTGTSVTGAAAEAGSGSGAAPRVRVGSGELPVRATVSLAFTTVLGMLG